MGMSEICSSNSLKRNRLIMHGSFIAELHELAQNKQNLKNRYAVHGLFYYSLSDLTLHESCIRYAYRNENRVSSLYRMVI